MTNIPLVTMTPDNGATELWLGTHRLGGAAAVQEEGSTHGERASGRIRRALLAGAGPPCQPVVRKGSIVVRDLRLWHAGMPNFGGGGDVRVMLAMIHFAPWYRSRMRLAFAEDVRPLLEGLEAEGRLGLDVDAVDWVARDVVLSSGPGGYLQRGFGNSYDFDQEP